MKALILNSGTGSRMGELTKERPKCMAPISENETILGRQLDMLADAGIGDAVITTGAYADRLHDYCRSLDLPINCTFVHNEKYRETNYIYSIYRARGLLRDDDIILMHGDLVFEAWMLREMLDNPFSCMAVSMEAGLPEKDFKAVLHGGKISEVGTGCFGNAVAAQPLYKMLKKDWLAWLEGICSFCEAGNVECYAEEALNEITGQIELRPHDVGAGLCSEIDNMDDLARVSADLRELREQDVYMGFSTDVIHSGHIAILKKAAKLGRLVVGILSDCAVAGYKRFPLVPYEERKALFENMRQVSRVVEQKDLSYKENLMSLKPAYVVHGDDWREGIQKPIRDEAAELLSTYGGRLVEFPYAADRSFYDIERRMAAGLSIPDFRRGRLKRAMQMKGCVNAIEAHSGITGLIAEKTVVEQEGKACQFDAMWISSLCDSTARGKPDIELVDVTSRLRTVDDVMEVTTKPIIFDGDTGGLTEHFIYTVRTLERIGVSMIIIEDKVGLKKNSLFGNEAGQTQDTVEHFCAKLAAGKKAKKTNDFMIAARIESLILEKGMDDALHRAKAYVEAGADGIMIHSRKKEPDEVFEFMERFREADAATPLIVVPTTFSTVTEDELRERGANVVIYANQLTRSGFPAMREAAELILKNRRAEEADGICMPIKEIINLIPDDGM